MKLVDHQKDIIANEVARLASKSSQSRVAWQADVSVATINKIINYKWLNVSDEMFRRVVANLRIELFWRTAETANFKLIQDFCKTAQKQAISIAISEHAGKGKSNAYTHYEREQTGVVYVECKNFWTKKEYCKALCSAAGIETHGTLQTLIARFIKHIKGLGAPLIIIDQFDKLKDNQMDLFMDLYNEMDGNCGFILSGVRHLEKRILRGVQMEKIGHEELYSRIGRKFIRLDPISFQDVKLVCNANGLHDESAINEIYNQCAQDLRRVKREVEKFHLRTIQQKEIVFEDISAPAGTKPKKEFEIPAEVFEKVAGSKEWSTPGEAVRLIRLLHPKAWQNDTIIYDLLKPYLEKETATY